MQFTAAADGRTRTAARSRPSLPRGVAQRAQMDDGKLLFSDGGGGGVLVGWGWGGGGRGGGGVLGGAFKELHGGAAIAIDAT